MRSVTDILLEANEARMAHSPPRELSDPPARPRGRPTKATPTLIARMHALREQGLSHRAIAARLGVGPTVIGDWLARGGR